VREDAFSNPDGAEAELQLLNDGRREVGFLLTSHQHLRADRTDSN